MWNAEIMFYYKNVTVMLTTTHILTSACVIDQPMLLNLQEYLLAYHDVLKFDLLSSLSPELF